MFKKIYLLLFILSSIAHADGNDLNNSMSSNKNILTIRECINQFRQENVIFLISNLNYASQYVIDVHKNVNGIKGNIIQIDSIKEHALNEHNIIAIGTLDDNLFIKKCIDLLPIKFDSQSISIENKKYMADDLSILLSLPNPYNPENYCIISTTNNISTYSPLILYQWKNWNFIINRKSDGRFYENDNLAVGNFKFNNDKFVITNLKIYNKEPKNLSKLSTEGVQILYDYIPQEDAYKILNVISAMRQAIIEFGIKYDHIITVYLTKDYSNQILASSYTDAINTFWSKFESIDEFYNVERMQIAILAHEMARIAFQPWLTDKEKIGPLEYVANDWSHYFQYTCIVPYVWDKLGAEGWPHPHDYNERFGLGEYNALYQGCKNTYTQVLYEIDQKYGKKIIADVVNEVTDNGKLTFTSFEDFMIKLAERTKDDKLIEKTKNALPTPMENTYRRRIHPIGITPTLDEMIYYNRFIIKKVEVNSIADNGGLKSGDEIIKFNGHDVKTEKDLAHRKGLQAWRNDGYFTFQIKRQNKIHDISIKIKPR